MFTYSTFSISKKAVVLAVALLVAYGVTLAAPHAQAAEELSSDQRSVLMLQISKLQNMIQGLLAKINPSSNHPEVLSAAVGSTLASASSSKDIEAYFNLPVAKGVPSNTLRDKIIELINSAAVGSVIRVSVYNFSDTDIRDAFVNANQRGVSVRLVVDDTQKTDDVAQYLTNKIDLVHVCSGACLSSSGGINHNKFLLFSELTDGSKDVVVQGSYNFTQGAKDNYEDLVVIKNDSLLYESYKDYWQDQRKENTTFDFKTLTGDSGVKAYFFPKRSQDTIINILDNVSCVEQDSKIRIGMGHFRDDRGDVIAKKLKKLINNGCDIQVIAGARTSSSVQSILGSNIRITDKTTPGASIHSKFIALDASYNGSNGKIKIVWTGSHNFTDRALDVNDEALIKLGSKTMDATDIYDDYIDYWNAISTAIDG